MKTIHTLLALSTAILLTACANTMPPAAGPMSAARADRHAAHHAAPATSAAPTGMHDRMRDMQAMRDRMTNAKTPAERQALMEDHMKSMHEGMAMMNGMRGMPMDMTRHHQMMAMRMDMMHTMMEMMMQRMPGSTAPSSGK